MKEEYIIKRLTSLQKIQPDADFVASSKLRILYQTPHSQRPRGIWVLTQGLSTSLSIGLAVIMFAFITVLGVSNFRSPMSPTFEGVDQGLVIEAGELGKTIDIHLEEAQYVADVASDTLVQGDHEAKTATTSDDEKIDNMLDEAINL
jgi:hypothetical protein